MQLEQRWQAMLQLHLSDQQKFIVYYGASYIKDFMVHVYCAKWIVLYHFHPMIF